MEKPTKKGRGGRRKLPDEEKKSSLLRVRCKESEMEILIKTAKSLKTTVSDYVLNRALDRNLVINRIEIVSEINKIGADISRCGNNINQIAKHINSQNRIGISSDGWREEYNKLLEDYIKIHAELRTTFRKLTRELSKK